MAMISPTGRNRQCRDRLKNDGMRIILLLLALCPAAQAAQADGRDIEGEHGRLYVHGALAESACRLGMSSAYQEVSLGETGTGQLKTVGDRGTPVRFTLRLEDCLRSPARNVDPRSGLQIRDDNYPAVTVSFLGTQDADNPALVSAHGVSGMGLRLTTTQGEDVRLGSRGRPLLLTTGQNTLDYTITPERTAADLVTGRYRAAIDFYLSYD